MRLVDTREPWDMREKLLTTGWEQQTLHCGDMAFAAADLARVGCTRKTMLDLLSSIGEVFSKQLEEMLTEYDICIFILEDSDGVVYDSANDELIVVLRDKTIRHSRLAVVNWLHRWYAKGFVPERTKGLDHTVRRLNELYALYQKPYSRASKSKRFSDDRILALPSGLRGKKGEELLVNRSLHELAAMGIVELEELDGIGAVLAARVYNHFNRR